MTLFEYLSVALSIVLAFGATHILGNLRYVFESGRRYWVHAFIVILILILYPQNWWAFWDLSRSENWNSYTFLLSVLGPGILYMMVVTLIPTAIAPSADWKEHFRSTRPWFYTLTLIYLAWAVVQPIIMLNAPIFHPFRLGQIAFLCATGAGLLLRNDRADAVFAWVLLGVIIYATYLRLQPEPWWLQ
jgi:hypothetical protein